MTDLPSILDLLDLKQLDDNRYQSQALYEADWGMYGGQVAAQALYAAGLTVADGRLPHSLHAYFVRRGDTRRPTVFLVDRDRDGFSFSARRVVASQDGEVIFTLAASFTTQGGRGGSMPDQDAEPAPVLPAPEALRPWTHPKHPAFEFRVADEERRLPGRFWIRCTTETARRPAGARGRPRLHLGHLVGADPVRERSDGHRPQPGPRRLVPPAGPDGRLDLAGTDAARRGGRARLVHRDRPHRRRDTRVERDAGAALRDPAVGRR